MSTVLSDLLLWGTIVFWILFWIPAVVHCLSVYYKNRERLGIRQRHYQIVIIIGTIFIYTYFIDQPIALIDESNYYPSSSFLHYIHCISFPIQVHGIKLALVWRYFAAYFDINFVDSMANSKWKSILSSKYDENDWFLSHKKTFGNLSWQFKIYIIIWIIMAIFSTIISNIYHANIYSEWIASTLHGICIFIYAPILIYLYQKMPNINDALYIKLEIKYITFIFIFQFIVYFLSISLKHWLKFDNFTLQYIWSSTGLIAASLYLYFFTIWTLKKCVWNNNDENLPHRLYLSTVNSLSSNRSNRSTGDNGESLPELMNKETLNYSVGIDTVKPIDLYSTLRDDQGYELFMNHLMGELSHEILLSYTELVQYKIEMKKTLKLHIYSIPADIYGKTTKDILLFKFPDIVPMSSIVTDHIHIDDNENVIKQYKMRAYKLFIKYIHDPSKTCDYEINISHLMRDPLIKKLSDYDEWMDINNTNIGERELFSLYDECIIEMYDLMGDSFMRFKTTPQFKVFEYLLND